MSVQLLETTNPATADCGMRTFAVQRLGMEGEPLTVIEVTVVKLEDRSGDGEERNMIEINDRVPGNREVAEALVNLGAALINAPGQVLANAED